MAALRLYMPPFALVSCLIRIRASGVGEGMIGFGEDGGVDLTCAGVFEGSGGLSDGRAGGGDVVDDANVFIIDICVFGQMEYAADISGPF